MKGNLPPYTPRNNYNGHSRGSLFGLFGFRLSQPLLRIKNSRNFSFTFLRRILTVLLMIVLIVVGSVFLVKHVLMEQRQAGDLPNYKDNQNTRMSTKNLASKIDFPFEEGCRVPDTKAPRASAAFVMLARNSELADVVSSMRSMERHFNQWFEYPWVFLNDDEFTDAFKREVRKHTKAGIEFGTIDQKAWNFPENIDKEHFSEYIQGQGDRKVMYGNLESYHKMCRFYSGNFYDHPLVQKRDWYWRVEPDVQFFCDLTYDPFLEMERHGKKYGFNVLLEELYYTVPSLFLETKAFIAENNLKVKSAWDIMVKKYQTLTDSTKFDYFTWTNYEDLREQVEQNLKLNRFLKKKKKTDDDLKTLKDLKNVRDVFKDATSLPTLMLDKVHDEEYNLCHFWSNFEIARTDIFLSDTYQKYFKHLETVGGFYKERWGDAPVHSLAVAMMLDRKELHYFRDIGYQHSEFGHCPNNAPGKQLPYVSNGFDDYAPKPWYSTFLNRGPGAPAKNGVGCRCECPRGFRSLEDMSSQCIKRYAEVMSDDYSEFQRIDIVGMEREVEKDIDNHLSSGGSLGDKLKSSSGDKKVNA
ncbi:hypothetical protein PUMCH_003641 [Australozyma saopauloensis]|uniref:Mannosyltransferase n=1 Tax=Australozyma saopauloensis TaxID=291208 RepID=A0AAX4HEI8_9ASCO|nr:hypothetical protein PUMCH_003641 [[Candida] saopauloensis]